MKHLDELNILIDRASAIAGSDTKLAAMLGVPKQHVSMWRKGTKVAQPEDQALLAGVAGLDPLQTLARATVEYWEGKPKGDKLMKVLGKPLLATGVVSAFVGAVAMAIFSMTPQPSYASPEKLHNVHKAKSAYTIRVMSSAFALK